MTASVLDFRKAERILRGSEATRVREARLLKLMGPKLPETRRMQLAYLYPELLA